MNPLVKLSVWFVLFVFPWVLLISILNWVGVI